MPAQEAIRKILAILAAAIMLVAAPAYAEETEITVGVYHFPPIASVGNNGEPTGLLGDLLHELEQTHPTVSFRVFHTSPKRRYMDFEAGLYDVIFFESPDWGWTKRNVDISRPILADEELYVALKKPGRDTSFFEDLEQRSIVAISGYHYGFTGYETDNSVLEQKFDIEFSDNHTRNLKLIKADRPSVAEVAIISYSYLQRHLARHPEDWDKLMISREPDQRYQLSIIARKGGAASADEMLRLLTPLIDNGRYRQLVENWGLQLPAGFEGP
ncbi:ABC-type amino acid transport substrate-binding protein [Marinobacter sp. es.048]|uniref:substrate-binding periplasmic protein n=1 Tax=Marinobacter sp. es.048 TaxID=1761795 RepID=UPI000B6D0AF6|nr:transporter substrate-binding domain-containing protein [Marinobacter sp. es.048]SNC61005.1 ABC-type amino acid transport substrate-binding protein [Marinobacter sp. es.048]